MSEGEGGSGVEWESRVPCSLFASPLDESDCSFDALLLRDGVRVPDPFAHAGRVCEVRPKRCVRLVRRLAKELNQSAVPTQPSLPRLRASETLSQHLRQGGGGGEVPCARAGPQSTAAQTHPPFLPQKRQRRKRTRQVSSPPVPPPPPPNATRSAPVFPASTPPRPRFSIFLPARPTNHC